MVCPLRSKPRHPGRSSCAHSVGTHTWRKNWTTLITLPPPCCRQQWRDEGVPVVSSSGPWTTNEKDSYVERGCHRSATEHAPFLQEELADNRFWTVLPCHRLVCDLPQLQPSPAAMKEERERKPRLLCDRSWNPVNDETLPHAPLKRFNLGAR
jgi:hypothetical protein